MVIIKQGSWDVYLHRAHQGYHNLPETSSIILAPMLTNLSQPNPEPTIREKTYECMELEMSGIGSDKKTYCQLPFHFMGYV